MTATTVETETGVHILGIRHHGPGSARSLRETLARLRPDIVLIEGPPDADGMLTWVSHEQMNPPVALLIYRPEKPSHSVYYPFAEFSPEWQALLFAARQHIPAQFMDLPMTIQLGIREQEEQELAARLEALAKLGPTAVAPDALVPNPEASIPPVEVPDKTTDDEEESEGEEDESDDEESLESWRVDPLQMLAEAAGFQDGERWWEHVVEHRRDGEDLFAAVREAMTAVRDSVPVRDDLREQRREAWMRQTIRQAQSDGFKNIAVICGAWHSPALDPSRWPKVKDDNEILKGLPKIKVTATWVPWTHGRLSYESGYGAGITSPGWYHHLWTVKDHVVSRWLTKVARLLRNERLDASSASVIEAVRLSESLATLRGRPLPGLQELDDAVRTVLCFGDETPYQLVRRKLMIGESLGTVPDDTPMVPLQQDLIRLQKSLRLPADPEQTTKVLDLRQPTDLDRSRLLHRLGLLSIAWGNLTGASGKGTFKEAWVLQWKPEFVVSLIESSFWGTTILDAANAFVKDRAEKIQTLPELTSLLDRTILSDLNQGVETVMGRLETLAALSSDVSQLMEALPPLANLLRYGNVRKTDSEMVSHATDGIVARICIGLPLACSSLDDDAADTMFQAILKADAAIKLLQNNEHLESWHRTILRMSDQETLHQLLAGRFCRILLDAHAIDNDEAARRMNLSVSPAVEPAKAAAWIDGFVKNSGELLYHDDQLFAILDRWIASLSADAFNELLPLLRRTFSAFDAALRRNLGEKAKNRSDIVTSKVATASRSVPTADFDTTRAESVFPLLAKMLGLPEKPTT